MILQLYIIFFLWIKVLSQFYFILFLNLNYNNLQSTLIIIYIFF